MIDLPFRPQAPEQLRACFSQLRTAADQLVQLPLAGLLSCLERLAWLWQPEGDLARQASSLLAGVFSQRTVAAALHGLALSMQPDIVRAELARELGRLDLLDSWQPDEHGVGLVRGFPLGVVAQVLAGNVFLGGVIALAQGLLTRNAVLLKLSSEDSGFTELFAKTLRQVDEDGVVSRAVAVCAWNSSHEELNQVVREEADAVVVWGGQSAVAAYPPERCRGRVIHYGPRLGIGFVLRGVDLDAALPELAWDVALWEQRACSSPRLLFVEDPGQSGVYPAEVAAGLSRALAALSESLPPRPLSLDDKAEVLAIRELAWWQERAELFAVPAAMTHTVLLANGLPSAVPLGYRTVRIVPFASLAQIGELLAPYRASLQTAVLAVPPERWLHTAEVLARAGLAQVVAAGSAAARFLGLPHEGEFALRRLVRLVGIDLGAGPLTHPNHVAPAVMGFPARPQ
jgi:hypothetical protein